ncbi:MAG: TIGR03086 family metal-binding protein [Nocardioidaceae bacterium]
MTTMFDLAPAAGEAARLLRGISDDQLDDPTPCTEYRIRDLADHIGGLALAFTWAATKDPAIAASAAPAPDGSRLEPGWRARFGDQLEELALAWKSADAWEGMTRAGGVDLPGDVAGMVALNELVIHGWDLAAASHQEYRPDPASLEASLQFMIAAAAPDQAAMRNAIFGPIVPMPDEAPVLERVLGLSGRNPSWVAPV